MNAPTPAAALRLREAPSALSVPTKPHPKGKLQWRMLLRWLVEDGLLKAAEATRVLKRFEAGDSSLHPLLRLGGAGLDIQGRRWDAEQLTEWLAKRFGLPYLRIDPLKVDVGRVAEAMSLQYAEKRLALPVQFSGDAITIATAEPFDADWVAEIEGHTRKTVRLALANPAEIRRFAAEFYAISRSVRAAQKTGETAITANFEQLVELGRSKGTLDANDQGVVQVVDWLWQYAFDQRASDIHLEPRRDIGVIRFRIDGVLHNVYQLPLGVMSAMIARIKLLGRMDVVERRRPLDGRIKTRRPDAAEGDTSAEVEMRLSTLPTAFGEKMVMRIFSPDATAKSLAGLGFSVHDAERWQRLIHKPHGIILVTGPTGSGKTTTLYATLKSLASDAVNICTLEDPIEMIEPSFNQTQVQTQVELGFAEGLRALMRQDPDILMVGEIRDLPTAEMAVQAALTGHLVFSTLHTNDAAGAVTRLIDLGVPPYLVSATVIGVLAQRLVRTLCTSCRESDANVNRASLEGFIKPWRVAGTAKPYRAVGCLECRHTGYRGRAGLYELIAFNEGLHNCIHPTLDVKTLRERAAREGTHPLRLSGIMAVAAGLTTLDEVLRSTPVLE